MLRLASGSPRRIELLRTLGAPFAVSPADIDESRVASPALGKAEAVARPGEVTIAIDTLAEVDGEQIGKPRDEGHAVTMLANLAGRDHTLRSEVVVVGASRRTLRFAVRSRVHLRDLTLREIERYVASGEGLQKAGGFAIQGEGRRLVAGYDGCYANITGLPLCHVFFALRRAGVATPARPEAACQAHFDFDCPVWRAAHRQGRALANGAEFASWSDDVSGSLRGGEH